MNQIQIKLLEILKEFIRVCDLLDINYCVFCGTLLGTVRHQGFIPWDDDVDVAMPRKDYDIFIEKGQQILASKYFIQCHDTEKEYFYPFAKLRDSSTTAIEHATKNLNINQGMWIDIFPLDGVPSDFKIRRRLNRKREFLERSYLRERHKYGTFKNTLANLFVITLMPSKRVAFSLNKRLTKKYLYDDCDDLWFNWNLMTKIPLKKEWFRSYIKMRYEDIYVNVPIEYEKCLESNFGNWKLLPPIEKRVSIHTMEILDTENSYTNYLKN